MRIHKEEKQVYRIGVDAILFGTAQAVGIGRYTEELIRNIVELDTENKYHVILSSASSPGFPIYAPNLSKTGVNIPHYSYSEQFKYPSIIKNMDLDLIHYTNFNSPIFFNHVPSVVTIHDLTLWFFPGREQRSWFRRLIYRLVIKKTCQNAKQIIAITKKTKEDIVNILGINKDKITVVYEAVSKNFKVIKNQEKINKIKHKFGITKTCAVYVGQWREHKNVIRMIRAFSLLRRRYNIDCQLVMVGKIDNKYPQVQKTVKELNLGDDIIFTGYIPDSDLPYIYNGAQFFVWPSLYEGFGLPPLEAMACGVPVISSDASCMPEVLGEAAHYFDPLNVEAMAKIMADVAKSYSLRRELKLKGLRQVKKYSFRKSAKETLKVYDKVL